MSSRSAILLGLLVGCGVSLSRGAELPDACRVELLQAAPATREAYKRRGEYCEGVISLPISGPFVAVAFVVGELPDPIATVLPVVIPSFVTIPKTAVRLLGTNKLLGAPYRLDANFPASGVFRWNLDSVAKPIKLSPADIGLVGIWQRELTEVLVPLAYAQDIKADSGLIAFLKIRMPEDFKSVEYRLRGSQPTTWQPFSEGPAFQGQVLDVPIPVAAIIGGSRVDIRGDTLEQPPTRVTNTFDIGAESK